MDYTKKQISEITRLSLRLVQFYTEEGVVIPDIDEGKGRGKRRKYSCKNLTEFLLIKELSDYGITLQKIKFIMNFLNLKTTVFIDNSRDIEDGLEEYNIKTYIIIYKDIDGKIGIRHVTRAGKGDRKDMENLLNGVTDEYQSILIINFSKLLQTK
ncbi:MAG: MerR family transcriptional regulator [Deltaproteobacteria bacterium]|nr:MerR family transcriptional regulator [Deltaproteobacteria bacterium]